MISLSDRMAIWDSVLLLAFSWAFIGWSEANGAMQPQQIDSTYSRVLHSSREAELIATFDQAQVVEEAGDGFAVRDFHRLHSLTVRRTGLATPEVRLNHQHRGRDHLRNREVRLDDAHTEEVIIFPDGEDITEREWRWDFTPLNPIAGQVASVANPTLKTSGGSTTQATSETTASITVSEGDEIFLELGTNAQIEVYAIDTPTDSFGDTGGSAWTRIDSFGVINRRSGALWHRRIGSNPSDSAITMNTTDTVVRWAWIVATTSGQDTSNPISEFDEQSDESTSVTTNIADIASGNLGIVGLHAANQNSIDHDADFIELAEASSGGTQQARVNFQYDPDDDETSNTTTWEPNNDAFFAVFAEIAAESEEPPEEDEGQIIIIN